MKNKLQAPFPYFGGKSAMAPIIWQALGNVKHYIEPFFGSGAVLLNRPNFDPKKHIETINDKNCFVANVWRSLQFNPDEVAKWCDWPVNHIDLSARKIKLMEKEEYLREGLISNPEWFDAKLAGYWIWAASCWIGFGFTSINQRPDIASSGKGVHKIGLISHINNGEKEVKELYNVNIYTWFRQLSERLRQVRVVCGDWTRVCDGDWQDGSGIVGMYFDPPYGITDRDQNIYHHDGIDIAKDVLAWCRERGKKKTYRIIISGYEEYHELLNEGWTIFKWSTQGGYANTSKEKNTNRHREKIYFSPHCINARQIQIKLDI